MSQRPRRETARVAPTNVGTDEYATPGDGDSDDFSSPFHVKPVWYRRAVRAVRYAKPKPLRRVWHSAVLFSRARNPHFSVSPRAFEEALTLRVRGRVRTAVGETYEAMPAARHRSRLVQFGFTDSALANLEDLQMHGRTELLRRVAAWQLAVWHAAQDGEDAAARSLLALGDAIATDRDLSRLSQPALLQAHGLARTGEVARARDVLQTAHPLPDVHLALDNLDQVLATGDPQYLNLALAPYGRAPVDIDTTREGPLVNQLRAKKPHKLAPITERDCPALVSIIVTTHNDEATIGAALESLLVQTWSRLEILVVDAGSTDRTKDIVKAVAAKDPRVTLVRSKKAGEHAAARNLALGKATGDFVTCHGAGEWAHPERIATQASHLVQQPWLIGNSCQQATVDPDSTWHMLDFSARFLNSPASSLMFQREQVLESLGYWDLVSSGSHLEFRARVTRVFGSFVIANLTTGPLIIHQAGYGEVDTLDELHAGRYCHGAAREYAQQFKTYHDHSTALRYAASPKKRPFPAPMQLLPGQATSPDAPRHFDVLLASDFGLVGGSTQSNLAEVEVHRRNGLTTGIIQMFRYDGPCRAMLREVQEVIDGESVQLVSYGDYLKTGLTILRYPPVLQEAQVTLPHIETEHLRVVVNQPPMSDYGEEGVLRYNVPHADAFATEAFGKTPVWSPIGPQVRETLEQRHKDEIDQVAMSDDDWVNIIDLAEWKRPKPRSRKGPVRIGRHSRDHAVKWPADPEQMLAIYPDDEAYEIHVMGGADVPRTVLGELPSNWKVKAFGSHTPRNFLTGIDVFVYYTHPDWVESFGRVALEAMAVGVPTILPPIYRPLFGEAAIYAEPHEVRAAIDELMADPATYQERVDRAHAYVEANYGYSQHLKRVQALLDSPPAGA